MSKRNMNEIEKDYKRIRNVVDTTPVTSIKDIAKATNLSEWEVRTSLDKHPRVKEKIKAQLEQNRKDAENGKKTKKETPENQNIAEKNVESKQDFEEKRMENPKVESKEIQPKETAAVDNYFVIDASITGIEDLKEILSKHCVANSKIILTSVTIKELEKLQKFNDIQAIDACNIMNMSIENPNNFQSVLIDESLETPDDCIIKYCADNKDRVTLLTSDKGMVLKARMYGVQTQYLKQTLKVNPVSSYSRKTTLLHVRKIGGQLFISDFNTDCRSILLISKGLEYTEGVHKLKIGDEVYIATKKPDYMTFAHYHITSLSTENNCNLIYSKRIYNVSKISDLPKEGYKSFMRDFLRRHDL